MDLLPAGIIGGAIALAAMGFVFWSANRRKPGVAARTVALYGSTMIAFATLTTLGYFASMAIFMLSVLEEDPVAADWVFLGLGVFGLVLAAAGYDAFTRRIDWSSERLVFKSWRGEAECNWADIDSVDYKPIMQYWRIGFRGIRRSFALFDYMTGAPDFLEAAKHNGVPVTFAGRPSKP